MALTTAQESKQVALNSVVLNVDAIVAEKVGINCSCFTVGKLISPAAGWQWMAAIWVPYGHGIFHQQSWGIEPVWV